MGLPRWNMRAIPWCGVALVACQASETPSGEATVRVVTWNVESLGAPGDDEYEAVADVLARIDADIVALNEIQAGEESDVLALADALGYPLAVVPDDNPFGTLHNAMWTRLPLEAADVWTSTALSGDDGADDVTRWPITMRVTVGPRSLTVAGNHLKSGFADVDAFRRAVDAIRTAAAAQAARSDGPVVVCGDLNAELADAHPEDVWRAVPADVPGYYAIGEDLRALLDGPGIPDDPFAPMVEMGLSRAPALQPDGRDATRDSSSRVIDHVYVDAALTVAGAVVYDARDDADVTVPLSGEAPAREATEVASDHFPVFADIVVRW